MLFSAATTKMRVFWFEASFTSQNNWKIRFFQNQSAKLQNINNVKTGDKLFCFLMECQFSGNVTNNPAVLQPSSTCQWFRLLTVCCQRFTHQPIVFLRCEANAYFIGSGCAGSLFFLLASRGFAARRSLTRVANWRKEKRLLAVYFKLYLNSLVYHRNIFGSSS